MLVQRPLANRKKTSGPRTETGTQILSYWGIVNKVKDCVIANPVTASATVRARLM